MAIFISIILFAVVFAILFTRHYKSRRAKANARVYFNMHRESMIERLNIMLVRFGQKYRKELEQKLIDAGIYNTNFAKYYFPIKMSVIGMVSISIVMSDFSSSNKLVIGMLCMIAIIVIPDMVLAARKAALIRKTSQQLPYMLDMMSVCVQTGMTIEASLVYLGAELESFDKDLCFQIRKTSDSARLYGLEKALNDLSERIPTSEVRSFVLTLIQNLQYGTSIANVLSDLSEDMRKMEVLTIEEKIGKLSAKMSIPLILFIMFPIVILILAPGIMQMSLDIG
ncbi:type II secretion system F family protein [Photobacterium aquae]|uniref:type II secretion system F family protein n=1 Tax=Photobacterium aquae TaxID=1195763 RepID=UPI0009FFC48E|nr:type II secretion system F family protein [Photobacterium aquae]